MTWMTAAHRTRCGRQSTRRARGAAGVLLLLVFAGVLQRRVAALFGDDQELQDLVRSRNGSTAALVITLAGTGSIGAMDGSGKDASFWQPTDVALQPNQRTVFVADSRNHKVRCPHRRP